MSHYGLLGSYQFRESGEDIRGTNLYGNDDDKLGKIDDVVFNHSTGDIDYVVVDTGGWLSTKKFLVPARRLRASTKHEGDFSCDLNKKQVEAFPPYDEKYLSSGETWADYEGRYRAKWETGPIMHRAETDRNITPTTQQLEGNQSSIRAAEGLPEPTPIRQELGNESVRAAGAPTERVVPAGTDSVVINNNATGIGGRWDTFQARLRERRKEAAASCTTCTVGPTSTRESADKLKEAI